MSVPTEYLDENHIRNRIKKLSKAHEDEIVAALNNLEKAMVYFAETGVDSLRNSVICPQGKFRILAVTSREARENRPARYGSIFM